METSSTGNGHVVPSTDDVAPNKAVDVLQNILQKGIQVLWKFTAITNIFLYFNSFYVQHKVFEIELYSFWKKTLNFRLFKLDLRRGPMTTQLELNFSLL